MTTASELALHGNTILVVDDHDPIRQLLISYLSDCGSHVDGATGGQESLAKMSSATYDLVLLDLRMDDMDGIEVLKQAKAHNLARNYVMMSAEGTVASAVEAIHLGASDFLVKPFELDKLSDIVGRVLRSGDANIDDRDPRSAWRDQFAPQIIGEHPGLLEIFLILERISHHDATVLVTGESGTGKELIARAIHNSSLRHDKPMIAVNCGAIAETLIESELFGHAKGAFTGATLSREGRFAAADKGTLFLDEIGEMSLSVQVKFLRVLQEGEFVPVGETRPRSADVRIIAATNKNLEDLVESGQFREDLFYRLNLIPIHLPPLRERKSDIPRIADHFLRVFAERAGRTDLNMSPDLVEALIEYNWPGNIRELVNSVERMVLLHHGSGVIGTDDLPGRLKRRPSEKLNPTKLSIAKESSTTALNSASNQQSAASQHPASRDPQKDHLSPLDDAARLNHLSDTNAANQVRTTQPDPQQAPSPTSPGDFRLPEQGIDLRKAVEEFEMSLIEQALARTKDNRNQASQLLGLNRTTLVEKLRKRKANR